MQTDVCGSQICYEEIQALKSENAALRMGLADAQTTIKRQKDLLD
jgi:hypothetical protein